MVMWSPFQDQYLHPIDSFIGTKLTEKLNFKVSDSKISKRPVLSTLVEVDTLGQ